MPDLNNINIGIIGLGYVGLPLAVALSQQFAGVVGFDINEKRVSALRNSQDDTNEVEEDTLRALSNLKFTSSVEDLQHCNVFIVTVPTPIDQYNAPDLSPLRNACKTVGGILKQHDIVIFESTVFPGATEEVCVPILEQHSKLKFHEDFSVGYSPERINPGDKKHRLENITKVTSGSDAATSEFIANLYASIIKAGVYEASSIKVAEAAKVIENTQRDLNIALMNELAIIFEKMDLDTMEVLAAAGTKWNFLPFRPGLVGGHCIGVDPYYLTHKAETLGYHPQVILAGRRINDSMGQYIVSNLAKILNKRKKVLSGSKVLVMGLTFKENCPDLRNSRVFDVIEELRSYDAEVDVFEPVAKGLPLTDDAFRIENTPGNGVYDAIIISVGHQEFTSLGIDNIRRFGKEGCVIYDVKSIFPKDQVEGRL